MLAIDWDTARLFLHVLGATIWVGGQLLLATLVPLLRRAAPDAITVAARGYARIAWPAFALLVGTGIWNVLAETHATAAYRHTLDLKLAFVAVSAVGAFAHQRTSSRAVLAAGGAMAGLGALGALFVGIWLAQ